MIYPFSFHAKNIAFLLMLLSFDILDVQSMEFDEFHPLLPSSSLHNLKYTTDLYKEEHHLLRDGILHTFHIPLHAAISILLEAMFHRYFGLQELLFSNMICTYLVFLHEILY